MTYWIANGVAVHVQVSGYKKLYSVTWLITDVQWKCYCHHIDITSPAVSDFLNKTCLSFNKQWNFKSCWQYFSPPISVEKCLFGDFWLANKKPLKKQAPQRWVLNSGRLKFCFFKTRSHIHCSFFKIHSLKIYQQCYNHSFRRFVVNVMWLDQQNTACSNRTPWKKTASEVKNIKTHIQCFLWMLLKWNEMSIILLRIP